MQQSIMNLGGSADWMGTGWPDRADLYALAEDLFIKWLELEHWLNTFFLYDENVMGKTQLFCGTDVEKGKFHEEKSQM